jgi:hypothetical protein
VTLSLPTVDFHGPFLAKAGTLDFELPSFAQRGGIYLWTVEFEGGYLTNYVGETIRPFPDRFLDHKKWYQSGKDVCDPDLMAKGENWLLDKPTIEQTIKFFACYRLFLAPMDSSKEQLLRIENAIIRRLLIIGGKCKDFLGNKRTKPLEIVGEKMLIKCESVIHGLGAHLLV